MNPIWRRSKPQLETLFVFLLAASVRLTSLGVFRAVDEEDRWAWGVDFYRALLAGNLPGTLVGDGYPGIFPAWLEAAWLFAASLYRSVRQGAWIGEAGVYALVHEWGDLSHLAWQRFPVVLANTVLVVVLFLSLRQLFGRRVALLSAIFIALDPFLLSDSRVNRAEALVAGLMMVSLLAFVSAQREASRKQLLVSGMVGGLAWLTKLQAVVLVPMFGAIGLLWAMRATVDWRVALRRWARTMGVWTLVAALTFVVLWPAVWTVPAPTFQLMLKFATRKVGAEGVNLFFLGRTLVDEDPGWLFYPVIILLRMTPLVLAGLLLGIVGWVRSRLRSAKDWRAWLDEKGVWALVLYVLLYVGGMSLGSHKQGRFAMAVFPALDVLAAMAYVHLARRWKRRWVSIGGALLLALQLATVLPFHPYYYPYFNPLLGGGATAVRLTRIGWGEGMDRVAAYLNTLEEPESLRVAARFYKYLIGFRGEAVNLDASGEWLTADKIVFYIQQVQRMQDPSPGVIRYFRQHIPPEKIIRLNGIDYAWIYPNPIEYAADPRLERLDGQLTLLGYRWRQTPDGATVTLVWENQARPPASVAVRLAASEAETGGWLPCHPAAGFEGAARTPGEVVESACPLSAKGLSPGMYSLQVGVRNGETGWRTLDFAAGWSVVRVTAGGAMERVEPEVAFAQLAQAALPPDAHRLEHTYDGKIRLLAYTLSAGEVRPGQSLTVTLYWQAIQPLNREAYVSVQAFAGDRQLVNRNGPPLDGGRPTATWRPGEVLRDAWRVDFPPDAPAPALVSLRVSLFDPQTIIPWPVQNRQGVDIPNAIAAVRLAPARWPVYRGPHPQAVRFGETIQLTGYESALTPAGDALEVTLYWRALSSPGEDYTAFVHLVDASGQLTTQSDVPPGGGVYPPSAWRAGEVVLSRHRLALPPDLSPGTYTLLAGLYRPADGARLPAFGAGGVPLPDGVATLDTMDWP